MSGDSELPTRVYQKGVLTVEWYAGRCVHCENCVTSLPGVFDTAKRPWIDLDGGDLSQIVETCNDCPSKALVAEIA